jgi:hypothetical protein
MDLAKDARQMEPISLGRLHLDAVRPSRSDVEIEARDAEALGAPPRRQLVLFDEGREDDPTRCGQRAADCE